LFFNFFRNANNHSFVRLKIRALGGQVKRFHAATVFARASHAESANFRSRSPASAARLEPGKRLRFFE